MRLRGTSSGCTSYEAERAPPDAARRGAGCRRGVSEGAAMLGLTQPVVSRSLAMLEARVGEPLFR
ncbi:LysR family transcriptional regulator [Mesorhizobium sp. CO1-1-8]|nr:LysR family transcriptional regulator [Mesorhizobium sp. CO1-1-8]